ncbi:hypothetical protein NITHO_4370002 [Nitrolancea hollandica Lb]|uniref:Uncharacterized protein n=1 Tax=Nitrolancea hollandica Lb TaxID=1129897 RepID=I4EK25_9BACT|nr:hypothetical protein NITHO_4370002 [Nitrolancea hollandica Lb]
MNVLVILPGLGLVRVVLSLGLLPWHNERQDMAGAIPYSPTAGPSISSPRSCANGMRGFPKNLEPRYRHVTLTPSSEISDTTFLSR